MSFFQQQCFGQSASISTISTSTNRKRKMSDDNDEEAQTGFEVSERRKLSMPHRGDAPATFLPLEAEDNLRMLMNLGLIGSNAGVWNTSDSPKSTSSDSLHGSSSDDGYFSAADYPNVDPYGVKGLAQAQQDVGMELDVCTPTHGPSCKSLPQLYVSQEMGSALFARCRDCGLSWEVQNHSGPSQTLSHSP